MEKLPPDIESQIETHIQDIRAIWSTDPDIALNVFEIDEAIAKFRQFAAQFINAGISVETSLISAEATVLAIVTHPRKVNDACRQLGLTNFDHDISSKLNTLGKRIKVAVCVDIAFIVADQLGIDPKQITDENMFAALETPQYETAALNAYRYFSAHA